MLTHSTNLMLVSSRPQPPLISFSITKKPNFNYTETGYVAKIPTILLDLKERLKEMGGYKAGITIVNEIIALKKF